jgi:hypothetical protein
MAGGDYQEPRQARVAGDRRLRHRPPEHAVEFFRLLGGGVVGDISGLPSCRLAVLPSTTHITLVHRADWLASMVEEFLEA